MKNSFNYSHLLSSLLQEMRFFELISDNTVIQLKVTGKGVTAHYSIKPQFLYAHLSAAFEGREDLVVVVSVVILLLFSNHF